MFVKNILIHILLLFVTSKFIHAKNAKKVTYVPPKLKDFIDNFKAVSMHFIEPFLKDIKVKDLKMEGFVTNDLTPIIAELMKTTAEDRSDTKMKTFAEALEKSYDICDEVYKMRADFDSKFRSFSNFENRIFPSTVGEYTAIPAGWLGPSGHGILLIIKKNPKSSFTDEYFDLIVINTGMGLDYHNAISDRENQIAPLVYRVWKRFEAIPREDFCKGNHWFIQALGLLQDHDVMTKAVKEDYRPDKHFYETILGNFKQYEVDDKTNDGKFLVGQQSGSCAYSSLIAGLLYISNDKNEFLTRKFMFGLTLLKTFLDKYEKKDIAKEILGDAYEPMARYLLKHLASGVAYQTLEFLESSGIDLGYANLLSSRSSSSIPSLNDLTTFKELKYVKGAVEYAVRIHKLLSDTKIDKTTAAIVHEDMSKFSLERIPKTVFNRAMFSFSKKDIEKLKIDEDNWPGTKHHYISSESDYTKFFPEKFSSADELARKFEAIADKSYKLIHLDTIMNTYLYDFFKIARPNMKGLISVASKDVCLKIMKSASAIMRNFMEKAILPMAVEDLAAMTQLLLLTWKAALRYDSQNYNSLGLSRYSAPITPDLLVKMETSQDIFDPYGPVRFVRFDLDTCAAAPVWLTTEDEYNAWVMFEEAKSELTLDKSRASIFNPEEIFTGVDQPVSTAQIVSQYYKAFSVLKNIAANYKNDVAFYSHYFNIRELTGPYLVLRGLLGTDHFPQYHYLIDVATYFYFGPWWRTFGDSDGQHFTFAQFNVARMEFGPYIYTSEQNRGEKKIRPFLRKAAVNQLLEYRQLASKTSSDPDFALNQFADIRAAAAMQYSQSEIRFYAFLSLIEGAKSCAFFEHSPLVFMADRLLGFKGYFVASPKLINRTYESLKLMISTEMAYFKAKHELLDFSKKEKHLDRLINATLVLVRFMVRLQSWNIEYSILKSKDYIESIAKIYDEWAPIGALKSIYELPEDMVGKVNLFLWDCVNSGKNFEDFASFSKTFVSNLSEYKTDVGAEDIVKAHVSYRYFMAASYSKQMIPSKNFDLITKIYFKLRIPCKLSNRISAETASKLIARELVSYFEPTQTDLDKDWLYTIDDKFEFIEIKKKDSKSKVPFIILRVSTGRIILNGVPMIHKSKIYNNAVFRQFFSTEDHLHARNGVIKPIGDKIGYSLSGFRGTGQNFLFITNGEDSVMDIYFHHENDRWLWSNPDNKATQAILRPLRLMNLDGIRVYQKYHEEKKLLEAIFMKGAETEPLYRLTIEKIDRPDESEIKIQLPFIEKPVVLLNSIDAEEKLSKAFKGFSDPEFISVYRTEDNRAVIMYGPYRFEKEEVPLIFEEQVDESDPKKMKKMFVLLNHDNWCIDEDQTLDNEKMFLGTIKIRSISDPESKAILVPNYKFKGKDEVAADLKKKKKKKKLEDKNDSNGDKNDEEEDFEVNLKLITVEMIKTFKGDLMPKDRFERLVLAYKFMINLETDVARKLLHPIQSIDQNSPFTDEELEMLKWILELQIDNPEINALKMMTATHFFINTFNYSSIRKKYSPSNIPNIAVAYLSSLREMSNKFYLHRTFPEVIQNEDLFGRLFHFDWNTLVKITPLNPVFSSPENDAALSNKVEAILHAATSKRGPNKPEGLNLDVYDWRKVNYILSLDEKNFWNLFEMIKNYSDNVLNYHNIHYRRNDVPLAIRSTLENFDFDLLLYCAKEDVTLLNNLHTITREGQSIYEKFSQVQTENIKSNLKSCIQDKRNEMIKFIMQPFDNSKSVTNIALTKDIFRKDLKAKLITDTFTLPPETYITTDVSDKVNELINAIKTFSIAKTKSGATGTNFFAETKLSYVLTKLRSSIKLFNSSNSIDGAIEVDLKSVETKAIYDKLGELQVLLEKYIIDGDKEIQDLTAKLVEITGTEKKLDGTDLVTKLSFTNHSKKAKTFASLYGCYYSMSLECFIKKFPHINQAEAEVLRDKTHIFYSKNVLQDYYNFMSEKTKALLEAKSKVSLDDLTAFVVEAEKLGKFNDRIQDPGILNFEFRSKKFRLREEQTNDLKILRTKDGSGMFKSVVIQRMMAAGKTLVLGTLATVLKAREPDILSILVPPSSLFQSNSASMQSRTYNYFKSRGVVLNFERIPLPSTEKAANNVLLFLKWFNDNLKLTLSTRNYLVMSPDSLQSFLNSYIEFLNYYSSINGKVPFKDDIMQSILKAYAEIYNTFVTKSSIILDEIDMTMNPKKELNYPTTTRESYNLIAVVLTTDLIEFSIFSRDVMKQDLNILRNNQAGLTSIGYENIKKLWLDYIETSLGDDKTLWYQKLLNPSHPEITKEHIMNFLRCTDVSKFNHWVDSIKTSSENLFQLKAIIIMKRQLDDFLQDALKSTVKEHFGPAGPNRPNIKYAVPYVAANTPSEASLFADRWETLNKSLLMTAVIGLKESDYVDFIIWLKEQVNIESITTGSAKITATYENFSSLISNLNPLSIDIEDPAQMKQILSEMDKKNRAAIRLLFSYYLDIVISRIEFPTEQITSNALHMSTMFASVQGYSGTIDNINILSSEVVPEAYLDHVKNEQNNGGIVQKLILDSNDKDVAIVNGMDSVKSSRNNVRNLLKAIPDTQQKHLSALIDVGAFFKNFKNAKVAESLLRINSPRIKCVLYYDENSNMLQYVVEKVKLKEESSSSGLSDAGASSPKFDPKKWEFNHGKLALSDPDSITKTTGHDLSERFTFYDQRHITGSDILQPTNAISLLTFGSRNLLRDLLQGALRMRQFMTTQKVFFAITPDVVSYYNSLLSAKLKALKASNVIALSAFNEDEKQGRENGALSFVKIDVRIRSAILKDITEKIRTDKFNEIIKPFKDSRSLFIRNFSENPLLWIKERKTAPAKDALEKFIDSRKAMSIDKKHIGELKPLIKDCTAKDSEGKPIITDSLLCFAPKDLPEFENDLLMNSEMQLELNSLQLNEFELESINQDSKFKDIAVAYTRFRLSQCDFSEPKKYYNVVSYKQIINHKDLNEKVKEVIEAALIKKDLDDIWFSRDLVNIVHCSPDVCPYNLFGSFNLEGTHIFVSYTGGRIIAMLVSNDVAEQIRVDDIRGEHGTCTDWFLTDLMGNIVASYDARHFNNANLLSLRKELKERFLNLLIINGSLLQLTTQPVLKELFFKTWVKDRGVNGGLAFLMSRMKILQNKLRFMFDAEDPLISTISKVINGDIMAVDSLENETYDSNSDKMKKLEKVEKLDPLKPAAIYRAQCIYDKVSIKNDMENPGLIYSYDNTVDDISDSGSLSSSDNESEQGDNKANSVDMLDADELIKIINDKTINVGENVPILPRPGAYPNSFIGDGDKYLSASGSSSNSFGALIVVIVLFSAAGIGTGIYYFCFTSDSESANKIGDETIKKKDDDYTGNDKDNDNDVDNDNGNNYHPKEPTYDSADFNPVTASSSYTAADNYYSNNAYNAGSNSAYNTNPNYNNANNAYYGSNNGYYNNSSYNSSGYNSAGYNSAGYYNAGYNTGYNNTGYNNAYNTGYANSYNAGYNNFGNTDYNTGYNTTNATEQVDYTQPPSTPPAYEKNLASPVDDFKFTEKHGKTGSQSGSQSD